MKQIPENAQDVKEILYRQLGLLAEGYKRNGVLVNTDQICSLTEQMVSIAYFLRDQNKQ